MKNAFLFFKRSPNSLPRILPGISRVFHQDFLDDFKNNSFSRITLGIHRGISGNTPRRFREYIQDFTKSSPEIPQADPRELL